MRIGLDARWIFPHLSGIGLHTRELIRHLAALPEAAQDDFVLFFNHESVMHGVMNDPAVKANPRFMSVLLPWSPFAPANQVFFPCELRKQHLDVYHSTNYMIPFFAFLRGRLGRTRCIITIHDLIPLKHPEYTPKALKTRLLPLFRAVIHEAARRADAIITVSECSRTDLIDLLRLSDERARHVTVIANGVDRRYTPGPEITQRAPTILYVGRLDPYKNVTLLIEAFARLSPEFPQARLRIVGPPDERYPEALNRIRERHLEDRVTHTGYLPDGELLKTYQEAKVLVLPSRYEGFGLPVVEAMACATPVICSNSSSLPEVAGDAALLVPTDNEEALTHALRRILSDESLQQKLSAQGPARAATYAWEQVARRTLDLYHHCPMV